VLVDSPAVLVIGVEDLQLASPIRAGWERERPARSEGSSVRNPHLGIARRRRSRGGIGLKESSGSSASAGDLATEVGAGAIQSGSGGCALPRLILPDYGRRNRSWNGRLRVYARRGGRKRVLLRLDGFLDMIAFRTDWSCAGRSRAHRFALYPFGEHSSTRGRTRATC
jgi:hypothetical protein